ncbi:hypothetical protein DFR70_101432 [Nocardia tenerifensis]|uniref:Uncharacterized protein n=1 Tax=Nocardia tenerifensis TaxID=228006 RepID=A0A318K901_9NOCA|nr:hypothetical protein [Nocardia tenerifensis]PXX71011.1 hypothetical protein DFR70_101432 [Nocardia tenerifensis]
MQTFAIDPDLADCRVDPGPMSAARAHRAMQIHLDCTVDTCRVRRRARGVLVQAGSMVLDPRADD